LITRRGLASWQSLLKRQRNPLTRLTAERSIAQRTRAEAIYRHHEFALARNFDDRWRGRWSAQSEGRIGRSRRRWP
jgi:hypothetical protein